MVTACTFRTKTTCSIACIHHQIIITSFIQLGTIRSVIANDKLTSLELVWWWAQAVDGLSAVVPKGSWVVVCVWVGLLVYTLSVKASSLDDFFVVPLWLCSNLYMKTTKVSIQAWPGPSGEAKPSSKSAPLLYTL